MTSDNDRYYVLTSATNPLFDLFTITFNLEKHSAVISVFQMATSRKHGGSADGYFLIHRIMAHVHKLLGCPGREVNIKVEYTLVFPEDGSKHRWEMPNGWGDVVRAFCICIPSHYLVVRRVNSLPILRPS